MTPKWEAMEWVAVARHQLDELAAQAAGGNQKAQRLSQAITNWDAQGRCINCKAALHIKFKCKPAGGDALRKRPNLKRIAPALKPGRPKTCA